jgi:hypothetical protein
MKVVVEIPDEIYNHFALVAPNLGAKNVSDLISKFMVSAVTAMAVHIDEPEKLDEMTNAMNNVPILGESFRRDFLSKGKENGRED